MAAVGKAPRKTRLGLAALGGFVAFYASWQAFRWIPGSQQLVGDLTFVPLNTVAAWLAWRASRRCSGSPGLRRCWRFVALALVSYLLADVIQTFYEVVGNQKPYPSVADVFYLLFFPLLLVGLFSIPTARRTRSAAVQLGLDLGTVALGVGTIVWYVVLGPAAVASGQSVLQTIFSIAYPVGDMVLIGGAAAILLRGAPVSSRRALQVMTAGLVAYVAADLVYGYITLHGAYAGGDAVDGLWVIAIALFAAAALFQGDATKAVPVAEAEPPGEARVSWLPYVAVAIAYGMVAITESGDSFVPDGALVAAASLLTAVVVLRQFLGQRELLKVHLELGQAHDELGALATTDPLTGIANHRALQVALNHELDRARRHDRRLAVLFLDLDHFKALNDTVGHVAGDEALQEVAAVMANCLRPSDFIGRWGGEEFLVLLPEADSDAAAAIAERVRRSVAERAFQVGHGYHLTCSIGAAVYPDDAQGRDALIGTADRAMYVAKHLGRNQVVTAASVEGDALPPGAVLSSRDEHAMIGAVEALAAMVDARDHRTANHATDVSRMSTQLAFALGCNSNESHFIGLAAQLHDIGKVIVPDAVLRKSEPLTDVEWDVIRQHPIVGAEVASGAPALRSIAPLIRSHHERWDGTGYPDQLAGEQIPFASRIIAVADAYSAMTSDRPYRKAMSDAAARTELERCAGTQFDSAVVAALEELREQELQPAVA